MDINVRPGTESDIPVLTEIFNYHIENGHSTFSEKPVTAEGMLDQFQYYDLTGPYRLLVAEIDGKIVGRASSFRYRQSQAFDKTVEIGIYLAPEAIGKGVGSQLYRALFDALSNEDLHLAVVGIGLPNNGSVALHKKFGFKNVGVFDEYALVKGKFYSSVWMQKRLDI